MRVMVLSAGLKEAATLFDRAAALCDSPAVKADRAEAADLRRMRS